MSGNVTPSSNEGRLRGRGHGVEGGRGRGRSRNARNRRAGRRLGRRVWLEDQVQRVESVLAGLRLKPGNNHTTHPRLRKLSENRRGVESARKPRAHSLSDGPTRGAY